MTAADVKNGTVRRKLAATTEAVVAAHEAQLREAMERASWRRRGLLGRLTRD
jgi:hypothetical protein